MLKMSMPKRNKNKTVYVLAICCRLGCQLYIATNYDSIFLSEFYKQGQLYETTVPSSVQIIVISMHRTAVHHCIVISFNYKLKMHFTFHWRSYNVGKVEGAVHGIKCMSLFRSVYHYWTGGATRVIKVKADYISL